MTLKTVLVAGTLAVSITGAATSAIAEGWASAFGSNPTEAQNNAVVVAEGVVRSRGQGCVDGRSRLGPQNNPASGVWHIEVRYNKHNGSCDRRAQNLRDFLNSL